MVLSLPWMQQQMLSAVSTGEWVMRGVTVAAVLLFWSAAVEAPKRIAGYFPERFAYRLAGVLRLTVLIMSPFMFICKAIGNLMIIMVGQNPNELPHSVTEEEIRMLVDEGEEHGTIEVMERRMINNIFEFGDREVSEVMTHRTEVSAVKNTASLLEITELSIATGKSRLPVFDGTIDNICGKIGRAHV